MSTTAAPTSRYNTYIILVYAWNIHGVYLEQTLKMYIPGIYKVHYFSKKYIPGIMIYLEILVI